MLRDSQAGLKTEHEHILGAMTARAKQLDVDVPLIEAAYIALAIKANWGNTLKNWLNSIRVGGESGIRTRGRLLTYTRFPGVRLKPLIHLSEKKGAKKNVNYSPSSHSKQTRPRPCHRPHG